MARHLDAHARQHGDNRPNDVVAQAEAALALDDPIDGPDVRTRLARLLHMDSHYAVLERLPRWVHSALARAAGPIVIPTMGDLRPMLLATSGGHNESFDNSPAWRNWFGSRGLEGQNVVRSIWHGVRQMRTPPTEQYDELATLLARHMIAVFQEAKAAQEARVARRAERQGPAARAKAAAAALEALDQFAPAFVDWANSARDAAGCPFSDLGQILPRLRGRLEQELAR